MKKKVMVLMLAMVMAFGLVGAADASCYDNTVSWGFGEYDREFPQYISYELEDDIFSIGPAIHTEDGKSIWTYAHKIQVDAREMTLNKATGDYFVVGAIVNPTEKFMSSGFEHLEARQVYTSKLFRGAEIFKNVIGGRNASVLEQYGDYAVVRVDLSKKDIKRLNITDGDKINIQICADWVYDNEISVVRWPMGTVLHLLD